MRRRTNSKVDYLVDENCKFQHRRWFYLNRYRFTDILKFKCERFYPCRRKKKKKWNERNVNGNCTLRINKCFPMKESPCMRLSDKIENRRGLHSDVFGRFILRFDLAREKKSRGFHSGTVFFFFLPCDFTVAGYLIWIAFKTCGTTRTDTRTPRFYRTVE